MAAVFNAFGGRKLALVRPRSSRAGPRCGHSLPL